MFPFPPFEPMTQPEASIRSLHFCNKIDGVIGGRDMTVNDRIARILLQKKAC